VKRSSHEALEHRGVGLAHGEPLRGGLRPPAERRALGGRITEAGRAVHRGDLRDLEQLGDPQHCQISGTA
jgi:hypothetical protein